MNSTNLGVRSVFWSGKPFRIRTSRDRSSITSEVLATVTLECLSKEVHIGLT